MEHEVRGLLQVDAGHASRSAFSHAQPLAIHDGWRLRKERYSKLNLVHEPDGFKSLSASISAGTLLIDKSLHQIICPSGFLQAIPSLQPNGVRWAAACASENY
jgi:hypothetical protein